MREEKLRMRAHKTYFIDAKISATKRVARKCCAHPVKILYKKKYIGHNTKQNY